MRNLGERLLSKMEWLPVETSDPAESPPNLAAGDLQGPLHGAQAAMEMFHWGRKDNSRGGKCVRGGVLAAAIDPTPAQISGGALGDLGRKCEPNVFSL